MIDTDATKIDELLSRGVSEVIDTDHLRERLLSGDTLRIKLGIDPTSPNLHLGRSVPLLKLADFQKLGHTIVFIVGNFTGLIGDTSDKDSERPMLDEKTVRANMETYAEQAAKIINIEAAEIKYNEDWLKPLGFREVGMLANQFSLHEFMQRENIKKRVDAGSRVSLRELLYPLMQGFDSVAVKSDVELGGTDQRFNLLAGRTLQEHYDQEPQDIVMTNLINGTDGRKMSSSWGNTVNLNDDAREMYGKIMSMPDDLVITYFTHCTRVPMDEVGELEDRMTENPMGVKKTLAAEIVRMYHGEEASDNEADWFDTTFSKKETPTDMPTVTLSPNVEIAYDVVRPFFPDEEKSNSDIRRLFEQGAVKRNEEKIDAFDGPLELVDGEVWQVGKRVWFKVSLT